MAYIKNPAFEVNDMTDGVVLFDTERNIVHHLNGPATLVWELLDDHQDASIVRAVARIMELPLDEAEEITRSAIEQLQEIHAASE